MAVEGIRLALIFIIKKEKGIYKGDKYPINGIGRILYLPQQIRNEADMNMKTENRGNRKEEKLTGNRDRLAALGLLAALWSLVLVSVGLWVFDQRISSMDIWQLVSLFLITQMGIFACLAARGR